MTNMKKTILASMVAVTLGMGDMATAQAAVVAVDVMTVTGGSFGLGFFTPTGPIPFAAVSGPTVNIAGQYHPPGWDVGTLQGGPAAGSIASFAFGSTWANTYTAPNSIQNGIGDGPFPPPSGSFDNAGGTTTFDIAAFNANWNGTDFNLQGNQGSSTATLTTSDCYGNTCNFSLDWTTLTESPFGPTATWHLTGTVSAVPVPAAIWLLGSGLVGLVGAVRRRKALA